MTLSRRGVLRCLPGIIAAPAVIKADALMRVIAPAPEFYWRGAPIYFEGVTQRIAQTVFYGNADSRIHYRTSLPLISWRELWPGAPTAAEHGAERGVAAG